MDHKFIIISYNHSIINLGDPIKRRAWLIQLAIMKVEARELLRKSLGLEELEALEEDDE